MIIYVTLYNLLIDYIIVAVLININIYNPLNLNKDRI